MLETILHNLTNIGWAMLIFLCAYLSNVSFSLYYNIKILLEPFSKEKLINSGLKIAAFVCGLTLLCVAITTLPLFADMVGWEIPTDSSCPFWTLPRRTRAMMKSSELVAKVVDIAKHYKTLYVMGCFGAPLTDTNKSRYIKNHPYNMAAARTSMIMAATPDTFGFDCVNLIKAVLWGWTGDKTKSYGGAKYATNGVPDEGADTMIKRCKDATASGWDKVDPGEVVWTTGHIGVYIGNGLAVECSPRWANNVQITAVGNIGKKNGYNTRMWKKHGHLPYVTYDKTVTPAQPETVKPVPTTEVKAKGVARSFNKAVAGTYTVTAGAGLNVRDAAGTESRVLVTIPKGTTVKNYGYYTVVNGVKWLYVAFSHKRVNYTGFVHERFLSR